MILARGGRYVALAAFALFAVPVQADVLQVDAGGAHWVSGPLAAGEAGPPASIGEVPANIFVPDALIADAGIKASLVPDAYHAKLAELAARFDVSPALIEAVVWQESRWRADALSPAGARGLTQLMPGTAREMGVDPGNPYSNLEGGVRYLRQQLDRFHGNLELALAAYNAGPGRVLRAGGIPHIAETRQYVAAIMRRLADHSQE